MPYSLRYLYVLSVLSVGSGIIRFVAATTEAGPDGNPSLQASLVSVALVLGGLALLAVTRLLDVIHHNTRIAALAATGRL